MKAVYGNPTRDQIEKNQAFFRGAVFKFKAALTHPDKANTFFIREIYLFKFQKITEPAPAALQTLDKLMSIPVVKEIVDKVFGQIIAPVMKAHKLTDEFVEKIATGFESTVSKEFADSFRRIAKRLRNDSIVNFVISPGSDWAPFQFHDQSPSHKVAALAGPAKRNSVDAAMHTAVHVDFGGFVANSWTNYLAHAVIISKFSLKRGMFGVGFSNGTSILVRGPYGGDAEVGVGNVITG